MVCEGCGLAAPTLKTVRWRTGERRFSLCDNCWGSISCSVWIVPGPVVCFGMCKCGEWASVRDLSDVRQGGGRWGSPGGLCPDCAVK